MTRFSRAFVTVTLLIVSLSSTASAQGEKPTPGKPVEKTALDHLRAARTTLDQIGADTLTADAAAKVTEVKKRLAALEQNYVSHGKKTTSARDTASGSTRVRIAHEGNWSSQVPEIDKALGQLVDPKTTLARQDGNDAIRRKLSSVRSHLTAFGKAATGTSGPPR